MSGTRSPSRKAQVTEALIVTHGQPSDPGPPEAALDALARRVAALLPGWRIRSATMAMPGRVRAVANDLRDGAVVYPLFMAKGWFVSGKLPKQLGRSDLVIVDPLGLDPRLADLAAAAVRARLDPAGQRAAGAAVIVAAHGSGQGPAAAEAANRFSARLRTALPGLPVSTGFVEQTPGIAAAASGVSDAGLCLPFFAMPGEHYQEDIPEALETAGFRGSLLPVIGQHAQVPRLIADAIRSASGQEVAA